MHAKPTPAHLGSTRWQDLALDIAIPLIFAAATAGFFVLISQF